MQRWKAQYKKELFRYLFLVLEGPSRLGKTQFALSLVREPAAMHQVNCAAAQEPDLRKFMYGEHEGILFDEIEPAAVSRQRLLFQAGASAVQLGCSNTNIFSYTVFVHRTKLICCSNGWSAGLMKLSDDDRAWVEANAVHVKVDKALWKE